MALLCAALLSLQACTFLIVRKPNSTTGGSGGSDGGDGGGCPVVTSEKTPTADLLVFVRMSGQAASLSAPIDSFVQDVRSDIESHKVIVTHMMVAPLVAEPNLAGPFDFDSCSAPAPRSVADTLQYFARAVSQPTLGACEHQELADLGTDLTTILPSYPDDFLGGSDAPPAAPFFTAPPTYVLVLFIDPLARTHTLASSQVSGADVAQTFTATGSDGTLNWLSYAGQHVPADNVFYMTIATSEFGETKAAMNKRCLALPGFPQSTLDFLQPGSDAYFSSFDTSVNAAFRGHSEVIDFCQALSFNGQQLIDKDIVAIHHALGLK